MPKDLLVSRHPSGRPLFIPLHGQSSQGPYVTAGSSMVNVPAAASSVASSPIGNTH